jgi:peptidoglycan-associated lipoprotein
MTKSKMLSLAVVLTAALFSFWGCPKKSEISTVHVPPEAGTQAEAAPEYKPVEAEVRSTPADQERAPLSEMKPDTERSVAEGLKPIYFDFDQAAIRDREKAVLEANAAWLKANPKAKIRIEGNCDERGTKEYNIALGQRRAVNTKKYLSRLGIAESRVSLISYGKEQPVCAQHTEECMQKNRRGDFAVTGPVLGAAH